MEYAENIKVQIYDLYKDGTPISQLSRAFGISRPTIYRIIEQGDRGTLTEEAKPVPLPTDVQILHILEKLIEIQTEILDKLNELSEAMEKESNL